MIDFNPNRKAATKGGSMPSLHRSQILRDLRAMQAQAAEFSGYAGKFRCFLERRILKQFALIYLF